MMIPVRRYGLGLGVALALIAGAVPAQQASGQSESVVPRKANPGSGTTRDAVPAPQRAPAPLVPPPGYSASTSDAASLTDNQVSVLILAGEESILSSQMAGRVKKVSVGLGDSVPAGAALIEFDCSEQVAGLQAADAEYRGARETHLTKLRLQALGAAGELEVTVAAAAADKAKSQVDLRQSQMAFCKVASPFNGRVARLRVKNSESVQLGQPVIDIVSATSLKAQMFVPASWIRQLRTGAPIQISLEDGRSYRAKIFRLNSRVEGVSQQLELEARFDGNTTGLLPGMVGTAKFPQLKFPAGR